MTYAMQITQVGTAFSKSVCFGCLFEKNTQRSDFDDSAKFVSFEIVCFDPSDVFGNQLHRSDSSSIERSRIASVNPAGLTEEKDVLTCTDHKQLLSKDQDSLDIQALKGCKPQLTE